MKIINPYNGNLLRLDNNSLIDEFGAAVFPKINGVFRIVKQDNYANNFGFQWNKFQAKLKLIKKKTIH